MRDLHLVLGFAVLGANAVVGVWGATAWLRQEPSVVFWYLLRSAQALVVAQVTLGLVLLGEGRRAPDDLHFLYGISPLIVTLVTEGMRIGAAERELDGVEDLDRLERREKAAIARRVVLREMGVMTIGAILIVTLSLRAASTSGGL